MVKYHRDILHGPFNLFSLSVLFAFVVGMVMYDELKTKKKIINYK